MDYCNFTFTLIIMNISTMLAKCLSKRVKGDWWSDETVKRYWGTYACTLSLYIQYIYIYVASLLYDNYAGIHEYPVSSPQQLPMSCSHDPDAMVNTLMMIQSTKHSTQNYKA